MENIAIAEKTNGQGTHVADGRTALRLDEKQMRLISQMRSFAEKAGEYYTDSKMLDEIFEYGLKAMGRTVETKVFKFQSKRNETVSAAALRFDKNVGV